MNRRTKKPGGKIVKHIVGNAGKLLALLLSLCLAALPWGTVSQAAEGYTYTVTFYPGNHGTFNSTGGISVPGSANSGISVSAEGQAIKVSGLKEGDMVSFDAAMEGTVALEEGSRYYVKGIRLSGRDNNTVDTSAFRVDGDRDYVVAYGIRGDMVSYVVNYQDESGNALAPSRSYYGNVGDKPVVAFLYVEGYEPMAYNLTKTLVSNEAENIFTFVYSRIPSAQEGNTTPGGGMGDDASGGNTGDGTETGGGLETGGGGLGDGNADGNGAGNGGAVGGPEAGETNGIAGGGMADGVGGNNPMAGNPGEEENITELGEEDVPLDLMELDEEEVPLADNVLPDMLHMEEGSKIFAASAVLVIVSAGVLIFFVFWLKRHSKNTK